MTLGTVQHLRLSTVLQLIRDDVRRLAMPLGLFAGVVVASGLARWLPGGLVQSFSVLFLDRALWLSGLLVAGLFGQAHSIHQRAYWRTRPWATMTVLTAKWIEVLVLVWLPMAGLQLLLLSTLELSSGLWGVWLGELFVVVGGPLLIAATLGALTRSVRTLLLVGSIVWLVVAVGPAAVRQLAGLFDPADAAASSALLTAGASLTLIIAYLASDRRRSVLVGAGCLAIWLGFHLVPENEAPAVTDPNIAVDVTEVGRPTLEHDISPSDHPDSVWLCVEIELTGRPKDGWIEVTPSAVFRSRDDRLELGSAWRPRVTQVMPNHFPVTAKIRESRARIEQYGATRGSLDLEVQLESKSIRVLADGPVQVGETVVPAQHLVSRLDIAEIEIDGYDVDVRMLATGIRHLTGPPDEPLNVRVDPEGRYEAYSQLNNWYPKQPQPSLPLPFAAQRMAHASRQLSIRFHPRPSWAVGDPRQEGQFVDLPVDEAVSELRWQWIEPVLHDRRTVRMTLDDVTLGELACDPARREAES